MFRVECKGDTLTVVLYDRPVIRHSGDLPFVSVAEADEDDIHPEKRSKLRGRVPLTNAEYDETRSVIRMSGGNYSMHLQLSMEGENLVVTPQRSSVGINRVVFSFPTSAGGCVYGCGSRGDSLNLRGNVVPIWVRDHTAKKISKSFWPWGKPSVSELSRVAQPTFVTDSQMFAHVDTESYSQMDFRHARRNRIEVWGIPKRVVIGAAADNDRLMRRISDLLGRQPALPDWCYGTIVSVSGGIGRMAEMLEHMLVAKADISAIVLGDWTGGVETPGGYQAFWDWTWNQTLYPRLDEIVAELRNRGVRVLGCVKPNFAMEGLLFAEASTKGYLIRRGDGSNYVSDMGGFMAGHLDLTNSEAVAWFENIINENIIRLGFSGYIADMGAFVPEDAALSSGESPAGVHNRWPNLWADLNSNAIKNSVRPKDLISLISYGYSGITGKTPVVTGDSSAESQAFEGGAALTSILSMSYSGVGICEYAASRSVRIQDSARADEHFLRRVEFAAFLPVMRIEDTAISGEFDREDELLAHVARMSRIHTALKPYIKNCAKTYYESGFPVVIPMSMMYPGEKSMRRISDQYLLGSELLVAPVFAPGVKERRVVFPVGSWINLWTGKEYPQGESSVPAPVGKPAVFFRREGKHSALFINMDK